MNRREALRQTALAAGAATLAIVLAALFVLGIQVALVALPLAGWCLALGLRAELNMAKRVAFGVVIAALVLTLVVELVVLDFHLQLLDHQ